MNTSSSEEYVTIFRDSKQLFWFTLICICIFPSFFCFLFDFYHVIKCRKTLIYDNINHHTILCLLVNDFIQISTCHPLALVYFYFGHVKFFFSPAFCSFWIYINFVLINQSLVFTMYASIERYFLVFYKQFMLRHKILTHYVPLLFVCLYIPCVLFYLIFFYPCEQHFDYTKYECGLPCFYGFQPIGFLNQTIHIFAPVLLIVIFNFLILVKIIIQKKRSLAATAPASALPHNNLWKQNRHMILQLTTISLLSSLAWIPYVISVVVQSLGNPGFASSVGFFYIINATYVPSFGTPFLVVLGFPQEIRRKIFSCGMHVTRNREDNPRTIPTL